MSVELITQSGEDKITLARDGSNLTVQIPKQLVIEAQAVANKSFDNKRERAQIFWFVLKSNVIRYLTGK